jgi:hypothetical protein
MAGMRGGWILAAALVTTGCGATVRSSIPDVNPSAAILLDFQARIDNYMELRGEAADDVPDAEETDDPADLRARENALAARIRALRMNAKHGDIFTPAIRRHFRRLLAPELKGEELDEIRDILREDAPAPGAIPIESQCQVSGGRPLSDCTVVYSARPAPASGETGIPNYRQGPDTPRSTG